ncbi:Zinc finger and BTB domain-containing protein 49, partial [Stegodyphus mimosarum]
MTLKSINLDYYLVTSFTIFTVFRRNYPIRFFDRKFQCDRCPYTTNVKGSLQRHMLTHTGNRPHHCPLCRKGFIQKSDLNIHLRRHTGEKPFRCDLCFKTYSRRSELTKHRFIHV